MKSINIYELSRLSGQDIELFQKAEQVMSNKESTTNIREHEKEDIFNLINCLMDCSNNIGIFDDFYYSYTIPQIGKEFDLLKFTEDKVLNLEIKHEKPNEENAILKQLIKNRYYLSHLNKKIISLTFVSSENLFLKLHSTEIF